MIMNTNDLVANLEKSIRENVRWPMTIMEVCGTHTQAIFASGIRSLVPKNLKIISGPGCPVCVTSQNDIERMIKLSKQNKVVVCTFGDMMRVPGSTGSLSKSRSDGADIRVMYSPFDVIAWARREPQKEFILIGIGFETTAPGFALTIKKAKELGIKNLSLFSLHKTVPEALRTLAKSPTVKIDGLLLPGHVSAIIGVKPYQFISSEFGLPGVISGFEGLDILIALSDLTRVITDKKPIIINTYKRIVHNEGNIIAQDLLANVFKPHDAIWRGIGVIPLSGLTLSSEFEDMDVEEKFDLEVPDCPEPIGCRCGEVILGAVTPPECSLFRKVCTPSNPIGPCMVSFEGTCSAYFKYHVEE